MLADPSGWNDVWLLWYHTLHEPRRLAIIDASPIPAVLALTLSTDRPFDLWRRHPLLRKSPTIEKRMVQ